MAGSRPVVKVATGLSAIVLMASLAATVAPDAGATAPIGVTGWHTHRGEIYAIVKAGELTHYAADCQQDGTYGVGVPITDPTGADHVHLARNLGTAPVVLEVTYHDPAGAPTSDSAPNPGCDFD